jgi:NADH:ubiquinone oxidoreductase subunit 6 (subunit J)
MTELAFWIIAIVLVVSAVAVVLLQNVFRAALLLIACFFGVAALYITLNADFLAAVQVLVYAGAIGILLLFAIMLTRDVHHGNPFNRISGPALLASLAVLGIIVAVVVTQDWSALSQVPQAVEMPVDEPTTTHVARALFDRDLGFVLPFEIASVLLLVALIGAVVLVRRKEKD